MSDLGTARGRVVIDPSGAVRGYGIARKADKDYHDAAERNSRRSAQAMQATGKVVAGVGLGIAAGFGVAINSAANFEERISAIGAVSGASEKDLEKIRQKALQLGADTKFSASEAASAIEELVKAGVPLADVMTGAADATTALAAAGEVDLTKAAEIASAAMNNFNLTGKDMGHVADLIAGAANASAIDVEQFGHSLQQSGAAAALVGLSFDDLSTAIALMGNAGIKGSDAGTSLKTMLLNLQPSTKKQRTLMKELGIITEDGANQFFNAEGKIRSFAEIAGVLEDALAGMTDQQRSAALETLFGSDAIRAAAVISMEGAAGFRNMSNEMGKISAADVAARRMDNFKGSLEQLKGSAETLMIVLGTPFLKILRSIVDAITSLTNRFLDLSPTTQKWIGIIAAVSAVLLVLIGGIAVLVGAIISGSPLIVGFGAVIGAIVSPIGALIAALVALGVGLFVLYKKNETFRNAIQTAWEWISTNVVRLVQKLILGIKAFGAALRGEGVTSDGFVGVMERIGVAVRAAAQWIVNTLVPALQSFGRWIIDTAIPAVVRFADSVQNLLGRAFAWLQTHVFPIFTDLGELISAVVTRIVQYIQLISPQFTAAFNAAMIVVRTAMSVIQTVVQTVLSIIIRAWELFGDNLIDAVQIAWNFVQRYIEAVLQFIRGIIQLVTALIRGDWSAAWEAVKTIASAIWQGIQAIIELAINTIALIIRNVLDSIHLAWNAAFTAIHAFANVIWTLITGLIRAALELIRGIIEAALNVLNVIWFNAWHAIHSIVTDAWGVITRAVSTAIGAVAALVSEGIDRLTERVRAGLQGISDIWNLIWGGMGSALGGIWDGIQAIVRNGVNLVIDVINWFIRLINNIPGVDINEIGKVGGGGSSVRTGRQEHARGRKSGGFITDGPQYLVGEGNRMFPEAVIATDPMYRKQNIGYWLWAGQQLGMLKKGGIPGYQAGGIIQGVAASLGGKISDFVSYIRRAALGPLFTAAKHMVDLLPIPTDMGTQVKNVGKAVLDRIHNYAAGKAAEEEARQAAAASDTAGQGPGGGSARGLVGHAANAFGVFRRMFPNMTIGGWRARGSVPGSDHPKGKALDLMTTSQAVATRIISTFMGMAGRKYWIWNRQIAQAPGFIPRGYRGPSPHTDHVHLSFYKKGGILSYLNGGTLLEDIVGIGLSTGRPYQMHGGEHVLSRRDARNASLNGNGNGRPLLQINNLTIQANTPEEGRAAGKVFLQELERRKILVDARLP